jgi:hypothetical protein
LSQLAFSGSPFPEVTVQQLIQQIESLRKAEKKLPTWTSQKGIVFPPKLNIEQTSSEATASYKASLVSGRKLADCTGGFGVDSYYFAQRIASVHHYEKDAALSAIAEYNFKVLGCNNIECFVQDGTAIEKNRTYDWLYADPGRRHEQKGKVFYLADCEPNIPRQLQKLFGHAPNIMIKTSPMLDISIGLEELSHVREIHLVAVKNEMKELLCILEIDYKGSPTIKTINLDGALSEIFAFDWNHEADAAYGPPERFLYEPNAAMMKGGAFALYSQAYRLRKLHPHSHLYTSESLREFPGRRFTIQQVVPYKKSILRKALKIEKANITTRNFPESVATLRKKWKIQEGGTDYLFFTTLENGEKVVLVTAKI